MMGGNENQNQHKSQIRNTYMAAGVKRNALWVAVVLLALCAVFWLSQCPQRLDSDNTLFAALLPSHSQAEPQEAPTFVDDSDSLNPSKVFVATKAPTQSPSAAEADDPLDATLSSLAKRYLDSVMEDSNLQRGASWLYTKKGLNLVGRTRERREVAGSRVLDIVEANRNTCNSSDIQIYVRVYGPEVIAGHAEPVNGECAWTFRFSPSVAGNYRLQAKLLSFNGNVESQPNNCIGSSHKLANESRKDPVPGEGTVFGHRFYGPNEACCEMCARNSTCKYFRSPAGNFICGMKDTPYSEEELGNAKYFGHLENSNIETVYYLGCGWSFGLSMDYPCKPGSWEDELFILGPHFTVDFETESILLDSDGPLCEAGLHPGSWIIRDTSYFKECKYNPSAVYTKSPIPVGVVQKNDPGYCWFQEDIEQDTEKCMEADCAAFKKAVFWKNSPFSSQSIVRATYRPISGCRFLDLSQEELQKCVKKKNVSGFDFRGASISKFMRQYFEKRIDEIIFVDENKTNSQTVVIDTLKSPHLLWHMTMEKIQNEVEKKPPAENKGFYFVVTPMFISSERENHDLSIRAEQFSRIMHEILTPKGYKILDYFHPSAAFTYEMATQIDGMHIIGLPMKLLFAQVMTQLCGDAKPFAKGKQRIHV